MERYNFQKIEKKWREKNYAVSVKNEKSKKVNGEQYDRNTTV